MNIRDLIDELEDIATEHGDDVDVRLAQQPRWSFEYSIDRDLPVAVALVVERGVKMAIAYISEGRQLGYLPHKAAVALGWAKQDEVDDDDDDEACPGCGCKPGDGITEDCNHPDGCGYLKTGGRS